MKHLRIRRTLCGVLSAAMVLTSFSMPTFAGEVAEETVMADAVEEVYAAQSAEEIENTEEVGEVVTLSDNSSNDGESESGDDSTVLGQTLSGNYTYDSTNKLVYAEFTKSRKIKIGWKVKGAARAAIYKITDPSTGVVTELVSKENAVKKKYYYDETMEAGIYLVELYDRFGSSVGKYITIPATYLMKARSNNGNVEITFPALPDGFTYTITKSAKSNFKIGTGTVIAENIGADKLVYDADGIGNVPTYTYVEEGTGTAGVGLAKKKQFYRIQAFYSGTIAGTTYAMATKTSNAIGNYGARYNAPVITAMDGIAGYPNAQIRFVIPTVDFMDGNVTNSDTTYEVYQTLNGNSYTLVTTVKGTAVTVEDSNETLDKHVYVINVSDLQPEQNYSYVIRAIRKSKKSEYSNAYPFYFHFNDVESVSVNNLGEKAIELRWKSDCCADSYTVYRTINGYTTQAEADAVMNNAVAYMSNFQKNVKAKEIKALGLKKAKAVSNTSDIAGTVLKTQIGKLQSGKYYAFYIVPTSNNRYGYDDGATTSSSIVINSPSNINIKLNGTKGYKITWPKVSKANAYLLERIEVSENAIVADMTGTENWAADASYKSWECSLSERTIFVTAGTGEDKTSAKAGVTYAYRVRAIYTDINGNKAVTTARKNKFKAAEIGPKRVTEFKAFMVTRGENPAYWDNNKKGNVTLSGNIVGQGGVKLTFKVNDKKITSKYEVQKTADNGATWTKLNSLEPGAKNTANTYKASNSTITFYDDGLSRGITYTYRVRPVGTDGTVGMWETVDFGVASSIFVYYSKNPNMNSISCQQKAKACQVSAGSTFRLYVDFYPLDATITELKIADCDAFELVSQGWEVLDEEDSNEDMYYVDLKATETVDKKDGVTFKYKYRFDAYDTKEVVDKCVMYFVTK